MIWESTIKMEKQVDVDNAYMLSTRFAPLSKQTIFPKQSDKKQRIRAKIQHQSIQQKAVTFVVVTSTTYQLG